MERYRRLIRAHVYDKCWQLDITWAEVEQLLDAANVVEETDSEGRINGCGSWRDGRVRCTSSRSSTTTRNSSCRTPDMPAATGSQLDLCWSGREHADACSGVEISDGDVGRVSRQPTEVIGIGGRDDRPAEDVRRGDEECVHRQL